MKEARYWERGEEGLLLCRLCPHGCQIPKGERGLCGARENLSGTLVLPDYGKIAALSLDPMEKKPLSHFHPAQKVLSVGGRGCNMRCPFCQNHHLSSGEPELQEMDPTELAALSLGLAAEGNVGIAYTYNEPLISIEYLLECAGLIRDQKQVNVLVTNGLINPEPLADLLPLMDALNIDLKSHNPATYQSLGGKLDPVHRTIWAAAALCHVEVTTLVVPGLNDTMEEMDALAAWLAGVNPKIPLHVSRFFPHHQMRDTPATPVATVYALADVARSHLQHVYTGNC